jgi:hypothetical protein
MARRRTTFFRQRDLTAAVKGALAAGCTVASVEINPVSGKIVVMLSTGAVKESTTDLDTWLAQHAD